MQSCYNCGRQVDDNVLICPECGALVRRYGRPESAQPEPDLTLTQQAPPTMQSVSRLSAGTKVWLVLSLLSLAFQLTGFISLFYIYRNQTTFTSLFAQFSELADVLTLLELMMQSVEVFFWFYVLEGLLLLAETVGMVWFLASRRRRAFFTALFPAGLLTLITLVTGGVFQALTQFLAVGVLFLLIRRQWKTLPR